jgi:hypothetical protein
MQLTDRMTEVVSRVHGRVMVAMFVPEEVSNVVEDVQRQVAWSAVSGIVTAQRTVLGLSDAS